jgi:beta-mannosidase
MTTRISLDGAWRFREEGGGPWQQGHVPGCVQLDLMALDELPDPFYRTNEVACHELEHKTWTYRRTFALTKETVQSALVELVFEGVDTLAEVYLNGTFVLQLENMFVPYHLDVRDLVLVGENTLEVRLLSPVDLPLALQRNSGLDLTATSDPARNFIRKAQYSYGWDWGPRITQVGIWRSVYLETANDARLRDPYVRTEKIGKGEALVRASVDVDLLERPSADLEFVVRRGGKDVARGIAESAPSPTGDQGSVLLSIPEPDLWWPNGMGDQPLYELTIKALIDGRVVDEMATRFGIRTVQLIQEDDAEGRSFVLAVNGVRVFAKGANWIPADNLLPRLTSEDYHDLIQLAADANMNMLRIWGGGIYEDSAFYEACDEMGLMVWQDFMYACAQYPDELDWFAALATDEARSVITTLRNHPSIVIWCGNNENNWGFVDWWHTGVPKYEGNWIYRELLPQVCAELDPSRPYWVSSPYGGDSPNCMEEGDRHSWDVWSGWRDYGEYLRDTGRFISEFGFQAMPCWKTVLSYTEPEDRALFSPVMMSHQKMVDGTERLVRFLAGRIGLPKDLKSFVYLTQFNQAEAIRTGVEHWRERKFLTSGALYWQFNDCWPVASWSCLDYYRRKKALWYASRRFYDDVLPILRLQGDTVTLSADSDLLNEKQAKATVIAYDLAGRVKAQHTFDVTLQGNAVTPLKTLALDELGIGYRARVLPQDRGSTTVPVERNGDLLDTVVFVHLKVGDRTYTNHLVFERFRWLELPTPCIQVDVEGQSITLTSDIPAFGVFVETEQDVELSDDALTLQPGVPVTISCDGDPGQVTVLDLTRLVARI